MVCPLVTTGFITSLVTSSKRQSKMACIELAWARGLLAGASIARGHLGSRILDYAPAAGMPRNPACLVQQQPIVDADLERAGEEQVDPRSHELEFGLERWHGHRSTGTGRCTPLRCGS